MKLLIDKLEKLIDGENSAPSGKTEAPSQINHVTESHQAPQRLTDLSPRISNGSGWFSFAIFFLAISLLMALFGLSGLYAPFSIWILFAFSTGAAATLASVGLIILIAHKIELRMIDIQKTLMKT